MTKDQIIESLNSPDRRSRAYALETAAKYLDDNKAIVMECREKVDLLPEDSKATARAIIDDYDDVLRAWQGSM